MHLLQILEFSFFLEHQLPQRWLLAHFKILSWGPLRLLGVKLIKVLQLAVYFLRRASLVIRLDRLKASQ